MDEKELEILIPSKTVQDYVLETGWKFTDFQKAALLCHRGLLLKDEYAHLKALGERTADYVLREQIAGYLGGIEKGFQTFRENSDRRCIYVLKVREDGGRWDGEYLDSGCFFDWETALACGKKEDVPFEIEKFRVDDMPVSEDGPRSRYADAGIRFDKDGEAVCFWSKNWVSKLMGHAKEIITMDVYADNRGIIADGVPEIEAYMKEVLPNPEETEILKRNCRRL